ncbi:MAG: hypothetical protein A3G25_20145 [Betaproteobacteria bacterium RIFCSPLOWO2_12_FULL_63_13]|nr:MAG: hypothetical protein A3G25_20145 [Betaproteobacteria bacterium RIFCSPLOWO2_12_FULL_63_13]
MGRRKEFGIASRKMDDARAPRRQTTRCPAPRARPVAMHSGINPIGARRNIRTFRWPVGSEPSGLPQRLGIVGASSP